MKYIGVIFLILFIAAGHLTAVIPFIALVGWLLFLTYGGQWFDKVTTIKNTEERESS